MNRGLKRRIARRELRNFKALKHQREFRTHAERIAKLPPPKPKFLELEAPTKETYHHEN